MTRKVTIVALAALLPFLAVGSGGCAALLTIEEGFLDESVGDGSAPNDGGPRGTGPGPGVDGEAPPVVIPATCQDEKPDERNGLFVSPSGTDVPNCGTKDGPCQTLASVVNRAKLVAGTKIIYVDSANYAETLTTLAPGVTMQGGWDRLGQAWRRQCVPSRGASVTIAGGSDSTGIRVSNLGGEATLDTLTIAVPTPTTATGQSVYGIFATGASTSIKLVDVTVIAGNGGKGKSGGTGATGSSGVNCLSGGAGGSGTPGSLGAGGGLGAFDVTGYTPATATSGSKGGSGNSTSPGTPQCGPCIVTCGLSPNCLANQPERCGGEGTEGCGGGGGSGGPGGGGGGSSVAVFAFEAKVSVVRGALRSGDGGAGGAGGNGGSGGSGTRGTAGTPYTSCKQACLSNGVGGLCQAFGTKSYAGGTAGPTGGRGGSGGTGGGGSGGHSYASYTGGGGQVSVDGAAITFGNPGAPESNGAAGKAGASGP